MQTHETLEDLLAINQRAIERIIAHGGGRALEEMLVEAEQQLRRRMERAHAQGLDRRWTGLQLQTTRAIVAQAIRDVQAKLGRQLDLFATDAARRGMQDTLKFLRRAERINRGPLANVLALEDALRFDNRLNGVRSSLLRQHATSVDRYGTRMLSQFERVMQLGILQQKTTAQMIDDLVGLRGPRGTNVSIRARERRDGTVERLETTSSKAGLFVDERYWAERIVRTELQNALNAGAQAAIEEEAIDFPDMKRLLVETFDSRTAADSVYAHGQIRGLKEYFIDGAGREYLHPPGRPNDRGRIVPWRDSWGKPKGTLAPRSATKRTKAQKQAGGATPPAPPPKPARPPRAKRPPKPAPAPTAAQVLSQRVARVQAVRQQHTAALYESQYAHLGTAAKSVAWGRAAMERGLDFPLDHALDVASRVTTGPLKDLHAEVSAIAQRTPGATMRVIAGQIASQTDRDILHSAAAVIGHLDGIAPRALPISVRSGGASSAGVQMKRDEVTRFSSLVDASVPFSMTEVRVTRGNGRAGYTPHNKRATIAEKRPEATVWHELAHAIEDHDPVALKRAVDFREGRCAPGEIARPLSVLKPGYNYGANEIAKKDQFVDPYTGKIYQLRSTGQDWGSEVTSMGMTLLGQNWRHGWKDPEHLLFTLGQLGPR